MSYEDTKYLLGVVIPNYLPENRLNMGGKETAVLKCS